MRRTSDGTYEPVDWDTAIAEVAARLAEVRDTHGGASIFYYGWWGQGNHLGGGYGSGLRAAAGSVYSSNALAQEKDGRVLGRRATLRSPPLHTTGDFRARRSRGVHRQEPVQSTASQRARTVLKAIAERSGSGAGA